MPNQTTQSIIVKGDLATIYGLWANFENFPHFMEHITSVTKTGERSSHWVMEGPLGFKLEWDAETTRLDPHQRIAWNSRDQGDITTSGQVTFKELPQGETEVTVTLQYDPPLGALGEVAATLLDDPEGKLVADLRRFKQFAERQTSAQQRAISNPGQAA
jgi:uncharacterized membrane protein